MGKGKQTGQKEIGRVRRYVKAQLIRFLKILSIMAILGGIINSTRGFIQQ